MARRTILFFSVTVMMLFPLLSVSAAGGGGGGGGGSGSAPACTEDTYTCSEWAVCSAAGKQTRSCAKTFDCPTVELAAPVTEQRCMPSAVSPAPVAAVPAVEVRPSAPELRCGNLAKLRERVACRLKLSESELAQELTIQYLPEECRALTSSAQEACLARYRALQPCWEKPIGIPRTTCAIKVLGIAGKPAALLKQCTKKNGVARAVCQREVRDKFYALIKFRMYDLSERAEDVLLKGAPREAVVNLVTAMETNKQRFNRAKNYAERRKTILDSRQSWQRFVAKAKGKETRRDYLDAALSDLAAVK